jgi:hypothetical protein
MQIGVSELKVESLVLFSIFTGIGKTLIEMEEAVRVKLQERKKIFLVGSGFTRERGNERE